jgi:hypothetical protein
MRHCFLPHLVNAIAPTKDFAREHVPSTRAAYFHKRDRSQPLELAAIDHRKPVTRSTFRSRPVSDLHCDMKEGQKVDKSRQPRQ